MKKKQQLFLPLSKSMSLPDHADLQAWQACHHVRKFCKYSIICLIH